VKEELTLAEISFVEAHRGDGAFPEVELIHEQRRLYPREGVAAHIVGYTREVSEDELNTKEFARYESGDVVGKAGIERYYNDILMGVDGQRRVVVDHVGRVRQVIDNKEAVAGRNLQLTIDLDLQTVAELAMENRRGAVVALDPRSGEVLALVSRPAYDPNRFAGRVRSRDWAEIVNDPAKPLLNRAIQAQLALGSTFKPFVAMAALGEGVIDANTRFHCAGGGSFYGRYFKCHKAGGHGLLDVVHGLEQSCDVFFYNVGSLLGIDRIAEFAEAAGFGRRTGVDLPGEAEGLVPSSQWKIRNYRERWYPGETISVAIGQGALTSTPLQLAYAMGGLVSGGVWRQPHLVKEAEVEEPRRLDLDPEHSARVREGLYLVVNGAGTGGRSRLPGIEFSGKTGTAQLVSNDFVRSRGAQSVPPELLKDNAWFVGFAPRENPELVVAVLFENGEHGPAAGLIARDVVKAHFDKKTRLSGSPRPAELAWRGGAEN
jgi:penicillin-binding protein 2